LSNPPPPQYAGAAHPPVAAPQSSRPPQPSPANPQSYPSAAHVVGVQRGPPSGATVSLPPHLLKPPPPQKPGAAQPEPQSTMPPHPSPLKPQVYPSCGQVFATQAPASGGGLPHRLNPPPPQKSGALHGPHWMAPPQLSPFHPHVYASSWHDFATHVLVLGVKVGPS
jgi:hypothetical protein